MGNSPENIMDILAQGQLEEGKEENLPGERQKGVPIWVAVTLGTLCLVLAAGCGVLYSQVNELNATLSLQTEQEDNLQTTLLAQTGQIEKLWESYSNIKEEYVSLSEIALDWLIDARFLRGNFGFIVTGSKYYHNYSCSILPNAPEYWAHNVEYCQYIGYSECPDCWPGENNSLDDWNKIQDIIETIEEEKYISFKEWAEKNG